MLRTRPFGITRKLLLGVSLIVLTGSGQAITASQVTSIVQANPELLNTPKVQAEMSKLGLSKSDILGELNKGTDESGAISEETSMNEIDTTDITDVAEISSKPKKIYSNPLTYKSNEDLLEQIKSQQSIEKSVELERFSSQFFRNKNVKDPGSLPVPDYYVVSNGDMLSIWVYGVTEMMIEVGVDSYGNVNIPVIGPIKVAGLAFVDAKDLIVSKLTTAYVNSSIVVNIAKYSTIQVSLTGNVNAPGIYNVSALSTVKDLLIHGGGVKANGTVRSITLQRTDGSIYSLDLYDLLLGVNSAPVLLLKAGDLIHISNAHKIVSASGAVNTPAKFELKRGEKLDKLLDYAGGISSEGSHYGLKVEGFSDNKTQVRTVDAYDASDIVINDMDSVYVYPIDRVRKSAISVYGNVVRPGERELGKSASLSRLLAEEVDKFGLNGVFLDNTLFHFAIIKRKTDTLGSEFVRVNLASVLSGGADETLKAGDELYVFNLLDTSLNPYVKIGGSVVAQTGEFQFIDGMTVSDLIQIAGTSGVYNRNSIKHVTYQTDDLMPKVSILSESQARVTKLGEFDEVELFDYYTIVQIPKSSIKGEINLPGEYVIHTGMSLNELIASAGGLTEKAYTARAEILRYSVIDNERNKEIITLDLRNEGNFALKNYDEVTIFRIPKWYEKKTITLSGQFNFPGTYTFNDGDKLSDLIERAGGFTDQAFLFGASFTRASIKEIQEQAIEDALQKLEKKMLVMSNQPREAGESEVDNEEMSETLEALSEKGRELTPLGRVTINLSADINAFKNSASDLVLKDGDSIDVPTMVDTVMILGEVMSPTAVIFNDDDDDVMSYIDKVGGFTPIADKGQIYVVHANGEADQFSGETFLNKRVKVKAGDVIVVPQQLVTSTGMQFAKDISSILYQFAVTAASLKTVGAF